MAKNPRHPDIPSSVKSMETCVAIGANDARERRANTPRLALAGDQLDVGAGAEAAKAELSPHLDKRFNNESSTFRKLKHIVAINSDKRYVCYRID